MIQSGGHGVLNVPQAGLAAGLGVEQDRKLVPSAELLNIPIALEFADPRIELMSGNEAEQLMKNRVIMSQESPPSAELVLDKPILPKAEGSFVFPRTRVSTLKVIV